MSDYASSEHESLDQESLSSSEQPESPKPPKKKKIPSLPLEVHDLIADDVVTLPPYYDRVPPPYFPSVFPKNPKPFITHGYALALAHPRFVSSVTPKYWKYVVVNADSHVQNMLDAPHTRPRTGMYRSTVRCNVFLPYASPLQNLSLFFASFPNLQTIVWDYPALASLPNSPPAEFNTVTTLKLGSLPPDFAWQHVVALDRLFPNLWSLQVVDSPSVSLRTEPSPPHVVLRHLSFLAVGTAWNFQPSEPYHENQFLGLLDDFPQGSLFPSLQELSVEHFVLVTESFFARHAMHINTLAFGSNNTVFYDNDVAFAACDNLSTLVIHLNPDSLEFPPLPDSINRIVIVQPVLPTWRIVKHMESHLHLCLDRVWTMPENFATEILCEARGVLSYSRLHMEKERWRHLGVSFSSFDFGTFLHCTPRTSLTDLPKITIISNPSSRTCDHRSLGISSALPRLVVCFSPPSTCVLADNRACSIKTLHSFPRSRSCLLGPALHTVSRLHYDASIGPFRNAIWS